MTSPHESLFDSRENAPERLLTFADRASKKSLLRSHRRKRHLGRTAT